MFSISLNRFYVVKYSRMFKPYDNFLNKRLWKLQKVENISQNANISLICTSNLRYMGSWEKDLAERITKHVIDPPNLNQVILAEGKKK